jgi:hypothetical protein
MSGKLSGHDNYTFQALLAKLRAGQLGVRIPAGLNDFSDLRLVQTGSETQPISCSVGNIILSRGQSGRVSKLTTHLRLVPK